MQYDVFFSISQTPVDGNLPSERQMFSNFFEQVQAADELGFQTAWIAESHLSSEVQKRHREPVIPHWQGEVGLNVDFLQLSHKIFAKTQRIHTGSAILNILCMGGPIAAAERVSAFGALHGLDPEEHRKIHVGFAGGRFDFMNAASGVRPRNEVERAAGRAWKNAIFGEAAEIFVRLLQGETLSSDDLPPPRLRREGFRTDTQWAELQALAGTRNDEIVLDPFWTFEPLKIIPQDWRRELLQLIIGSHDPALQEHVNRFAPVQVFNLSITRPEIIEQTHRRMGQAYHPSGGPWKRSFMPRTVFVFLNDEPGLGPVEQREAAQAEARRALGAYWTALEGTLDPSKVEKAADNALIGNADDLSAEIVRRFHPEDRLMLWFDFFNHDSARVIRNMEAFMTKVAPAVEHQLAR
ncbi:MAG: LLM class flavin-dependent oxidoreductase [Deltaproteobacteria bacterium]|nr:MAG: LLM class flavin-dependent oxidoreductase [Deltaproteobacteria bacterium]